MTFRDFEVLKGESFEPVEFETLRCDDIAKFVENDQEFIYKVLGTPYPVEDDITNWAVEAKMLPTYHCQNKAYDICLASSVDNICCADNTCDIDAQVRPNPLGRAKTPLKQASLER